MSGTPIFIDEEQVRSLLNWENTFSAVESAMKNVSLERVIQNPRTFTSTSDGKNVLLTMPGYMNDEKYGALACKLVTATDGNTGRNPPLPNIQANIVYFDEVTGQLKAIIAGTEITTWRTAAASAVATKYIHDKDTKDQILAIMGAGVQGRIHALCFQHFFKFKEVHIWNHRYQKCVKVVDELNSISSEKEFMAFENPEECVKNADVIVTATNSTEPVVKKSWIKEGIHINCIGAVPGKHFAELDVEIYKSGNVYIDHWAGAKVELGGLEKMGVEFKGEVGAVITGKVPKPNSSKTTIFQSLGMAVEDCAMARMIFDLHNTKNN